jgi:predicted Zn finger-like uncharacterized protein
MFTVCSKCNLRLTVTATDLRAAQGYVRCGRCHNVFNALAALADDPGRMIEAAGSPDTPTPDAPGPEPAAPARTAVELPSHDTSLEFNPASTNINEVFIEASADERTGAFESITLSGEDPAAATSAPEPDPIIAPQALSAPTVPAPVEPGVGLDVRSLRDALAEPDQARPVVPEITAPAALAPEPVAPIPEPAPVEPEYEIPLTTTWSATPLPEIAHAIDDAAAAPIAPQGADTVLIEVLLEPKRQAPRVPRWLLQGAVGILTLGLIAQVLHHYRAQLADTAMLRRPVNAIYALLGQPLEVRWDIRQYEIRQLGASTDGAPSGELVVRASISNRAPRDQPLPLLRVVMQDRFGNRVAGRDLKPAEYLGRGAPQVSLMAPGQRVDVQVAFQDPGQAATGFEIDACMASHAHTVTCANDPGGR